MIELYNLPNIRELLTNGFTDAELRNCNRYSKDSRWIT